jgi:hypothetical protein
MPWRLPSESEAMLNVRLQSNFRGSRTGRSDGSWMPRCRMAGPSASAAC